MGGPFFHLTVEEIEAPFMAKRHDRFVLTQIPEELQGRGTVRARQLLRETVAVLEGTVPMPEKPVRPAKPEDQLDLTKPDGPR